MFEKKSKNMIRQDFLLSFFPDCGEYMEKEINGYWLTKRWNGNQNRWEVAIFTQEAFNNYKLLKQGQNLFYETGSENEV